MGSTATSTSGSRPFPISSPKYSIGASSFSPSPITTVPFMSTVASDERIASTARASAAVLLPRPCRGAAASAPASVTRNSSRARLRLIFGSSIIVSRRVTYGSGKAAPSDREFVRLHPELFLARQPAVSARAHVDARALEDGGDADLLALEGGVEAVDQDLVLIEVDLAQPARAAGPSPGRELELHPGAGGRAGLDGEPGRRRPGKPDRRSWRSWDRLGRWLGSGRHGLSGRYPSGRFGRGLRPGCSGLRWSQLRHASGRTAGRLRSLLGARRPTSRACLL